MYRASTNTSHVPKCYNFKIEFLDNKFTFWSPIKSEFLEKSGKIPSLNNHYQRKACYCNRQPKLTHACTADSNYVHEILLCASISYLANGMCNDQTALHLYRMSQWHSRKHTNKVSATQVNCRFSMRNWYEVKAWHFPVYIFFHFILI